MKTKLIIATLVLTVVSASASTMLSTPYRVGLGDEWTTTEEYGSTCVWVRLRTGGPIQSVGRDPACTDSKALENVLRLERDGLLDWQRGN